MNVLLVGIIIVYMIDLVASTVILHGLEHRIELLEEKVEELERKVKNCGPWY